MLAYLIISALVMSVTSIGASIREYMLLTASMPLDEAAFAPTTMRSG